MRDFHVAPTFSVPNVSRPAARRTVLHVACVFADILQVYREALVNDAHLQQHVLQPKPDGKSCRRFGGVVADGQCDGEYNLERERVSAQWNPPTRSKDYNTNAYNVALSQPLFRWQNFVQYGQAKLQVAQAEATFAQASQGFDPARGTGVFRRSECTGEPESRARQQAGDFPAAGAGQEEFRSRYRHHHRFCRKRSRVSTWPVRR